MAMKSSRSAWRESDPRDLQVEFPFASLRARSPRTKASTAPARRTAKRLHPRYRARRRARPRRVPRPRQKRGGAHASGFYVMSNDSRILLASYGGRPRPHEQAASVSRSGPSHGSKRRRGIGVVPTAREVAQFAPKIHIMTPRSNSIRKNRRSSRTLRCRTVALKNTILLLTKTSSI